MGYEWESKTGKWFHTVDFVWLRVRSSVSVRVYFSENLALSLSPTHEVL